MFSTDKGLSSGYGKTDCAPLRQDRLSKQLLLHLENTFVHMKGDVPFSGKEAGIDQCDQV